VELELEIHFTKLLRSCEDEQEKRKWEKKEGSRGRAAGP
jgi:hypothetical protein